MYELDISLLQIGYYIYIYIIKNNIYCSLLLKINFVASKLEIAIYPSLLKTDKAKLLIKLDYIWKQVIYY